MFYALLTHMQRVLEAADVAERIVLGAGNPTEQGVEESGVVFLYRGQEEADPEAGREAFFNATFYLEIWTRNDDPDMAVGYAQLAELERGIDGALAALNENVTRLGDLAVMRDGEEAYQLLAVAPVRKAGDADSLRPLIGTQYTLHAQIYKP